ncbi:MAG: pyruvate kinase [Pseudomonadales bacterium]
MIKRKTKIVCTIGPATSSYDMLEKLYAAGMNVVRLNMSHGEHDVCADIIKAIRTLNKKVNYTIPVLLDTQGPEIRTGQMTSDLNLQEGKEVEVVVRGADSVEESSIHIDYADLIDAVSVGDIITVDNGLINLEVLAKEAQRMNCRVIDGGLLKSKKHVNLPGVRVNLPAITEKDKADIRFGMEQEVDFIALSFVREAEDVRELRAFLGPKAKKIKIIAKIEDQQGLTNLDEIIAEADGIMVARGDLGVEVPFYELPEIQRTIVRKCAEAGKRVIVATHLLESMITNPMPTRAEVTDVANAVYEEVDAVMLSGETTIGKHPIKCVESLDKIARTVEASRGLRFIDKLSLDHHKQNVASSAVHLADSLKAKGIVVITRRGRMANWVANCHPKVSAIYAFTNDSRTRRQQALSRGVYAHRIDFSSEPEKTLLTAFRILLEREDFSAGDRVVVISDALAGSEGADSIQVREVIA